MCLMASIPPCLGVLTIPLPWKAGGLIVSTQLKICRPAIRLIIISIPRFSHHIISILTIGILIMSIPILGTVTPDSMHSKYIHGKSTYYEYTYGRLAI